MGSIIVPSSALWPSEATALNHWAFIAGKLGAKPELPRPFLIGLRGVGLNDAQTHQPVSYPKYDDTFVLIVKGEMPIVFKGATHAYQTDSKLSPDVDGDGRGDVGSIRPGSYILKDSGSQPFPIFLLTLANGDGRIPAYNDTDHNGVISEAEMLAAINATKGQQVVPGVGRTATAVLMHTGWDAPAGSEHKSSIACQTTSFQWLKVLRDKVANVPGRTMDYALANAWDVVPFAEEFRKLTASNNVA